ncbi:MAG: CRISPR-associated endonuclease Cas2 [Acidobacteria bacterium]|nr:CRISPR-associated endonuclease Cas2 [Acidobacteriota bacterium]
MRHQFVIAYDIADAKRLRQVYKLMLGFGDHVQLSVFLCELSDRERAILEGRLSEIIHHREDQVILVRLGPATPESDTRILSLGRPYSVRERRSVVV